MRHLSPWRVQRLPEATDVEYFSPPESEEVHLRDYWRMLLKRRRLVVLVFLTVFVLGAYLTFSETPLYTASATLKIEPQNPTVIPFPEMLPPGLGGGPYDYYETQFALLKSRPIAVKVITQLKLGSNPAFNKRFTRGPRRQLFSWFSWFVNPVVTYTAHIVTSITDTLRSSPTRKEEPLSPPGGSESGVLPVPPPTRGSESGVLPGLIGRYLGFLTVSPVKNTRLVQVTFRTPDPRLSQELANAHAAAFVHSTMETRFELTKEAKEFLEKKLAEFEGRVQRAEQALQRFRQMHGVVSLEGNENLVVTRMVDLNTRLTEARARRIEQESLYRTVENQNSRYLSEVIDNNVIQQLKTSLLNLEAEHARLSTTFMPSHPRLIEVDEQIREARRRMDREIANVVRKIESDYGAARAREEALQAEAERQQQEALKLKEIGVQYAVLTAEVDSGRALHESVLKRLNETALSNDVPISNIELIEQADLPLGPSSPRKGRGLFLSAACGLFLGVGLALFREYMDASISTPEDVWQAASVPTLGVVPRTNLLYQRGNGYGRLLKRLPLNDVAYPWGTAGHSHTPGLVVAHHPFSVISESYRTIRTTLLLGGAEKPPQVIMLTSAHPGEGKTVTALNLAAVLAQSGNTLVIDADLRKGCCHTLLGQRNHRGLSQILTGSLTLEECVQETPVAGLSFLSRGVAVPSPADLLGTRRMREVLEVLRGRFDFVLIDSAPVLIVSDAAMLSRLCDGVLLVVWGQRTTAETTRRLVERLEAVRAPILGVVLNGVDIRHPDYADYRRYYPSYSAAAPGADR